MSEHPEFDKWWSEEGEFIRAGGGQYEISFAFGAWQAALEKAAKVCDNILEKGECSGQDIDCYQETADRCAKKIRALTTPSDER